MRWCERDEETRARKGSGGGYGARIEVSSSSNLTPRRHRSRLLPFSSPLSQNRISRRRGVRPLVPSSLRLFALVRSPSAVRPDSARFGSSLARLASHPHAAQSCGAKTCAIGASLAAASAAACAAADRSAGGGAPSVSGAADASRRRVLRVRPSPHELVGDGGVSAGTRYPARFASDPGPSNRRAARASTSPATNVRSSSRPVEATDESAGSGGAGRRRGVQRRGCVTRNRAACASATYRNSVYAFTSAASPASRAARNATSHDATLAPVRVASSDAEIPPDPRRRRRRRVRRRRRSIVGGD